MQMDTYFYKTALKNKLYDNLPNFHGILLDVGCGQMPYKNMLTSSSSNITRYIGLDLETNPLYESHPDITWQDKRIPLDSYSVDCAICTEVLEHCPEPEAVLAEIHRVLKPGGLLFFTVPFLWPLHDVPHDEYRYTPFSLLRHLSNTGYVDIDLNAMGGWDASLAQMLGLWVRRRPMKGWVRALISFAMYPLVYLLMHRDKKNEAKFQESSMITGIYGTARK